MRTPKGKLSERQELPVTGSGIPLAPLYTPEDTQNLDYASELGEPGHYPYTRGIQSTMYRGRLWTMRQYAGYGTAEETNRRYHYLLDQGQSGLSVAFDLPTQMGYDSDHPLAEGEVGKTGVAIDSLEDMERLFAGIPLNKVSTSMTINATAPILFAMYMALAKKQNVSLSDLSGTVQNDILKEYVARGTYIYPVAPSMRLVTDLIAYCSEHVPKWNPISISGYHIREAGATAVQEIAFTFANAASYVRAALEAGLDIDRFAPRLSFFFNAHNDFFEEIAKFRAARRLWARIMKDRFGAHNPKSCKLRYHVQTAGCTLTAQQPDNNVVRVTLQALAAVLGGTQSLHTNSRDEALSLPTEESAQIALRTQQIIAYESGVPNTVDPLGGSYFIEYLTHTIEKQIVAYLETIDSMGGALKAIEQGYIQQEIHRSAYRYQKEIENGERTVIGVNAFTSEKDEKEHLLTVDPHVRTDQVERLTHLKQRREKDQTRILLSELMHTAKSHRNVMPSILKCIEAYVTIGEISDVLREVFGVYGGQNT
ncbi:MAG: methylmalonyl-CoA mutase family protein [Gemmatimonadota bacterium]|nr:MAG: methylmalonyl-CoA mutase family protein [Gemmatimonadota bacterium]